MDKLFLIFVFWGISSYAMGASNDTENPFYEQIRKITHPDSGIICGTHVRAMREVDMQLELLDASNFQNFKNKHQLELPKYSLQVLYMLQDLGDVEARDYISKVEKEFNIKLVNVVYRAYYGIENESDATLRRCYKIGIDYRYMPRRLQCFWEIFFRNNIDLDLDM